VPNAARRANSRRETDARGDGSYGLSLSVGLSVGLLVRGMAVTRELEVESHREATESAVEGQLLRGYASTTRKRDHPAKKDCASIATSFSPLNVSMGRRLGTRKRDHLLLGSLVRVEI